MNIGSIASLIPSYFSPIGGTANIAKNANSASSVQQQADLPDLSPAAQFLSQLQQMHTQSPQKFQAILSRITSQLQQAASTASNNGNSTQAKNLTALATSFHSAAGGGALPTAQQLQQAGLTGHHHHHGGGFHASGSAQATFQANAVNAFQASSASEHNPSLAASIFGSIAQAVGLAL